MKLARLMGFLLLAIALDSPVSGQQASVRTNSGVCSTALPNVNQLALLRWYGANMVTHFPTGGAPNGITFDGSNLWVVGAPANQVTKIRSSDGLTLGRFPVGNIPGYAAFDGANIWVTNLLDNTVSKLRASDGATLGTIPTGVFPWASHLMDRVSGWGTSPITRFRSYGRVTEQHWACFPRVRTRSLWRLTAAAYGSRIRAAPTR